MAVVEVVIPSRSALSSSTPDSGGDTNRAVGRGPEAEGPLGLFRMGRGGLVKDVVGLGFGFDADAKEVASASGGLEAEDLGEGYEYIISELPDTGLVETHRFISIIWAA